MIAREALIEYPIAIASFILYFGCVSLNEPLVSKCTSIKRTFWHWFPSGMLIYCLIIVPGYLAAVACKAIFDVIGLDYGFWTALRVAPENSFELVERHAADYEVSKILREFVGVHSWDIAQRLMAGLPVNSDVLIDFLRDRPPQADPETTIADRNLVERGRRRNAQMRTAADNSDAVGGYNGDIPAPIPLSSQARTSRGSTRVPTRGHHWSQPGSGTSIRGSAHQPVGASVASRSVHARSAAAHCPRDEDDLPPLVSLPPASPSAPSSGRGGPRTSSRAGVTAVNDALVGSQEDDDLPPLIPLALLPQAQRHATPGVHADPSSGGTSRSTGQRGTGLRGRGSGSSSRLPSEAEAVQEHSAVRVATARGGSSALPSDDDEPKDYRENVDCFICWEELGGPSSRSRLACGHEFCASCACKVRRCPRCLKPSLAEATADPCGT